MAGARHDEAVRAEIAAAKAAAEGALPKLRALRQGLEREAGAMGVASRHAKLYMLACAGGSGLVGAYALLGTVGGTPPVIAWVVTSALAACALYLRYRSSGSEPEQRRELESLHTRMLAVGRQIDRAERMLRD
jgi:hypothetical protein